MTVWDLAGWVAMVLNIWGNLALTDKSIKGWAIRLVSNAFWIVYSVDTQAWALLANHVAFAGINVVGWVRWSRDEHRGKVKPDCILCKKPIRWFHRWSYYGPTIWPQHHKCRRKIQKIKRKDYSGRSV